MIYHLSHIIYHLKYIIHHLSSILHHYQLPIPLYTPCITHDSVYIQYIHPVSPTILCSGLPQLDAAVPSERSAHNSLLVGKTKHLICQRRRGRHIFGWKPSTISPSALTNDRYIYTYHTWKKISTTKANYPLISRFLPPCIVA